MSNIYGWRLKSKATHSKCVENMTSLLYAFPISISLYVCLCMRKAGESPAGGVPAPGQLFVCSTSTRLPPSGH